MFEEESKQRQFLNKYGISDREFRMSQMTWGGLSEIIEDFKKYENEHNDIASKYVDELRGCQYVHSLNYRVKDCEHLAEKIIRKSAKLNEKGIILNADNYREHITDLIGIRIILMFKEDWTQVHEFIMEKYESQLYEKPFAYVRKGDDISLYEGKIEIKDDKSYRSVHYVVKSEVESCIEIQVRTLAEEAWGEMDHSLRYPYNISNIMMNNYMDLVSRLAGMMDEMGTFVHRYIEIFENNDNIYTDNEVYNYILEELDKIEDKECAQNIKNKILSATDFSKMEKMSNLMSEFWENWKL